MEIENAYYKKIIYKKNAFEDIKTFLKLNYNNKKIMLISTKSVPAEDVTNLLNSLFCGSENVTHYVARRKFDNDELVVLQDKLSCGNFDLLVSFGGGKCCDVVKYFADKFDIPYIVCPTTVTSLAYFTNYCINPIDATKSFYGAYPCKIFIQEQIIKKSNCLFNIQGLCFLHSIRAVFAEGLINDIEKERYIFLGLEKVFNKLDEEQTNILLCGEDSNLVLMDLFIDFGFFLTMLSRDDYYLFNMYNILEKYNQNQKQESFGGRRMLLCAKTILQILKRFIEINSVKTFEKVNYSNLTKLIKNNNISFKNIKNNAYFNIFSTKACNKKYYFTNRENIYKIISLQILKIKDFCKKVKSVYKFGIEIEDNMQNVFQALAITPFIYGKNVLVDLVANSGILNAFMYS